MICSHVFCVKCVVLLTRLIFCQADMIESQGVGSESQFRSRIPVRRVPSCHARLAGRWMSSLTEHLYYSGGAERTRSGRQEEEQLQQGN